MIGRTNIVRAALAAEVLLLAGYFILPVFRDAAIRDQAARVASEIRLISAAATTLHARTGEWPEDAAPGTAPKALARLPRGLKFKLDGCELDWDHWSLTDGPDAYFVSTDFAAVSVIARDPRLARELLRRLAPGRAHFTLADRTTFVIAAPGLAATSQPRGDEPVSLK